MTIFNEIEKAKESIQKSNTFDVKEVAEYRLNKLIEVIKLEEQEFKAGKDKDYIYIIAGCACGAGILIGMALTIFLY